MIRNSGNVPLSVSVEEVSCTCTVADLPPGPIPPGGHATLNAVISSPPYEASFGARSRYRPTTPRMPGRSCGSA